MMIQDREGYAVVNDVRHWYRIAGAAHNTIHLVILHRGPGGNVDVFERTIGTLLEGSHHRRLLRATRMRAIHGSGRSHGVLNVLARG